MVKQLKCNLQPELIVGLLIVGFHSVSL